MPGLLSRLRPGSAYARIDRRRDSNHQAGWRPTVLGWMCVTIAVLLANVTLLIWASARRRPPLAPSLVYGENYIDPSNEKTGTITLSQGSSSDAATARRWTHFAINILGTLLLVASGYCMQCLSAPTRTELDQAHARGRRLDIGILSARNLRNMPWKRSIPWLLLALSSIPLDFFYFVRARLQGWECGEKRERRDVGGRTLQSLVRDPGTERERGAK